MIAFSATEAQRRDIAAAELYHLTRLDDLEAIVTDAGPDRPIHGPHQVHIKSFQGYSLFPFRMLRDYSILDTAVTDTSFYGCYLYFFLGVPSWWGIKKNVGPRETLDSVRHTHGVIRVAGAAVLTQAGTHVFYRPDDSAVVIRGEYSGPAVIGW